MFTINGTAWRIVFLPQSDDIFRRSDGSRTVGVSDNTVKTVFLSDLLNGDFLRKVLCHEIVHCFCFSYDLEIPIETEEIIADFVATYGNDIIRLTSEIMNDMIVPRKNIN